MLMHAARSVKIAHVAQAVSHAEPCASFKITILVRCMALITFERLAKLRIMSK